LTETSDASPRVIATAGAIVAGGVLAVLAIAWLLWSGHPQTRRTRADQSFLYGPADRPDVLRQWPAIERAARAHLSRYEWVDRRAGIVRIPIDQAMRRICEP
jgi:hypothetical protein